MARKKFTDAAVKRFPTPKSGRVEHWDSLTPGFGIRITDKGRRSWVMMTRAFDPNQGKKTLARFTLGTYPLMSLSDARKAAGAKLDEISNDIEAGIDTRQKRATPPLKAKSRAIDDAVAEFFRLHVAPNLRASTAEQYRIAWEVHILPRWAGFSIDEIKRSDIVTLLAEIVAEGKPVSANRTLSAIKTFYSWAVVFYDLESVPTIGVKPPKKEMSRERVLSDTEIMMLWDGTVATGWPFGPFVRFLLITAQRRSEVANMRWQDIDFEKELWSIPAAMTKANRNHDVPLSPLALEVLGAVPRLGEYVFTTRGDRPLSGFSKAKARLDKLTGSKDWTLHDLRRTAGTNMADLEIVPSTISQVLNHSEGGVTKIYVRSSFGKQKRAALNIWSNKLDSIIRPSDDNVVPLRG